MEPESLPAGGERDQHAVGNRGLSNTNLIGQSPINGDMEVRRLVNLMQVHVDSARHSADLTP